MAECSADACCKETKEGPCDCDGAARADPLGSDAKVDVMRPNPRAKRRLDPLPLLDESLLLPYLAMHDIKEIHAKNLWKFLIRNDICEQNHPGRPLEEVAPPLPQKMPALLKDKFAFLTSRVVEAKTSRDNSTTKLLIALQDGHLVESVIIRNKHNDEDADKWVTLCVSSQVGCQMACTFCATGTLGLKGNLTAGEICEQLVHANRVARVRNVVFMGMGEPMHNYEAVIAAVRAMSDVSRFGLAPSKITVSTVGIIPRMIQLAKDAPLVQLALSLHAPNQQLRSEIVPAARSFKLDKLMGALDHHIQTCKQRAMIEYVVLREVNDRTEHAHQLGALLKGKDVMVNLIPYNPTEVAAQYKRPDREQVSAFAHILNAEYGLLTTVRVEMGQDIDGACGQLAIKGGCSEGSAGDIEDLMARPRGKPKPKAKPRDKPPSSPATPPAPSATTVHAHNAGRAFKLAACAGLASLGLVIFLLTRGWITTASL